MAEDTPLTRDELGAALAGLPGVATGPVGSLTLSVEAPSFPEAVRLIGAVAEQAEALNHHPDVDLRWTRVTFALATHSTGAVSGLDVELARRILAAAAEVGAKTLPAAQRVELALDCVDIPAVKAFWTAALGYREQEIGEVSQAGEWHHTELQAPDGRGPVLWFQRMDPPRTERGRFHLDVYLPDPAAARERLAAALAAGGRLVNDEHAPAWWVVADPEGNELCLCTREPEAIGSAPPAP
jgi:4a-hydroxytetrahydrobiopterin dehydratase